MRPDHAGQRATRGPLLRPQVQEPRGQAARPQDQHRTRAVTRKETCRSSAGKVTWLRVQDIAPSARKHGIDDEDMRHALRNPLRVAELDDDLTMFTGPARDGTLLEVGVADTDLGPLIVHAMQARPKFLPRKVDR